MFGVDEVPGLDEVPVVDEVPAIDEVSGMDEAPAVHSEHAAPFYFGKSLVYPNVGDPVVKTPTNDLPFFFTIYRGETGPLTGTAQLLRNGGVVAEAALEIASSTDLRIQQLDRLPVTGLAAGTYELRITVASGPQQVAESAYFTLQD